MTKKVILCKDGFGVQMFDVGAKHLMELTEPEGTLGGPKWLMRFWRPSKYRVMSDKRVKKMFPDVCDQLSEGELATFTLQLNRV